MSSTLTSIHIEGFKCFKEPVDVAIRPLTLLAGANSGGKSSLMQPLLLLKQTLEAPFDPGPLLLEGPLVRLENASTLFWKGKAVQDRAPEWTIEFQGSEGLVGSTFSRKGGKGGLVLTRSIFGDARVVLQAGMSAEDLRRAREILLPDLVGRRSSPGFDDLFARLGPVPLRSFFVLGVRDQLRRNSLALLPQSHPDLLKLIHLPGLRGNPERAYKLTRSETYFPGPFQNYTAGVLLTWKEQKDDRLSGIGDDLRHLGLAWKVDPRSRGDVAVEMHIARLPKPQQGGAMDTVNIADVGFGASQVLPVVVALRAAGKGQVVHIEQPELHLHPRAQIRMADLLIAASKRGATVIIETHSSVLLRSVQAQVAQERILAKDVALHWMERDEDGVSRARSGILDGAGAYGDWPVDFADVEMDIERAYIEAAYGKANP